MEDANKVVDALAGKSITEVMEEGKKKLCSMPSGGAGGAAAAPAAAAAPSAPKGEFLITDRYNVYLVPFHGALGFLLSTSIKLCFFFISK